MQFEVTRNGANHFSVRTSGL